MENDSIDFIPWTYRKDSWNPIPMNSFPHGNYGFEKPAVCPECDSPEFKVTAVEGPVVICQCLHCYNIFLAPGIWTFADESDSVRVRKKEGKV